MKLSDYIVTFLQKKGIRHFFGYQVMNITNSQVDSNYGGQRDGGDAMSTINPDDIAQIT